MTENAFFHGFCAGEPIWAPAILKRKLENKSKLSGSIVGHKWLPEHFRGGGGGGVEIIKY